MSRELKFRAYDKENKKMYLQEAITKIDIVAKEVGVIDYTDLPTGLKMPTEKIKSFENIEIMQYTGIKDEHKKEIFEGDILYDSRLDEKYIVIFFEGSYVMEETEAGTTSEIDTDTEIIGNIYENPELLGED